MYVCYAGLLFQSLLSCSVLTLFYSCVFSSVIQFREKHHCAHTHTQMQTHRGSWAVVSLAPSRPSWQKLQWRTMCLQDGPGLVRDWGPTAPLKGSYCLAPPPSGTINYGPQSTALCQKKSKLSLQIHIHTHTPLGSPPPPLLWHKHTDEAKKNYFLPSPLNPFSRLFWPF